MTDRREFITVLGAVAATTGLPLLALAQKSGQPRRIAVLSGLAEHDPDSVARAKAFRDGLAALGWIEGRTIQIDWRYTAGNVEQARTQAVELVAQKPEVILAITTIVVKELQRATRTIPIVFASISDPIGDGFVASLARPGGNITGFMNFDPEIGGRWVELLKELAPGLAQVLVVFNPRTAPGGGAYFVGAIEKAGRLLGVEHVLLPIEDPGKIEAAIAGRAVAPNVGLIVLPDSFTSVNRAAIVAAAARHRLPAIYPFRFFAESGGLMSYGIERIDPLRRAADYVDRILKGAKPSELPVQAPVRYETLLNLKTAKALGLTVPPAILVAADEVIE